MPFKLGDVVRLKTGGPEMTVEAIDAMTPDVICTWVAEQIQRHGRFKSLTLQNVEGKQDRRKAPRVPSIERRLPQRSYYEPAKRFISHGEPEEGPLGGRSRLNCGTRKDIRLSPAKCGRP